ncbi:MAG: VanZ family protein [Actinobacteria bacterium]|nr:VanZ family protein [Actinomycetota bacterium]
MKTKIRKTEYFFKWFPVVFWMFLIFYFSSLPAPKIPTGIPDFIPHFIEYVILSYLVLRAVDFEKESLSGFMSIIYAASDEFHQIFVPGRVAGIKDLGVDVLGILSVIFLIRFLRTKGFMKKLDELN